MKEKSVHENQITDYKKKINENKSLLKSNAETIQELKNRISNLDKEYLEKLRVSREEEWGKITNLENQKSEVLYLSKYHQNISLLIKSP